MATKTVGMRIEEDQFNEIKETFPKASDFATWIISTYPKYESEHTADLFTSEIENLSSTLEALMNGIKRISTLSADIIHNNEVQLQSTIDEQTMCIEDYRIQIEQYQHISSIKEKEYQTALSAKENELRAAEQTIKKLEEQLISNNNEISNFKKEVDLLIRLNTRLENEKNEYEQTLASNQEIKNELAEIKNRLVLSEKALSNTTTEVKEIELKSNSILQGHKKEMELQEKIHALAVSQATVNATTHFQEQIEYHLRKEEELLKQIDTLKQQNLRLFQEKHRDDCI